jgi:hypothetical protein
MAPLTNRERQKRFRERHKIVPIHQECWCVNCARKEVCENARKKVENLGRTGTVIPEFGQSRSYWDRLVAIAISDLKSWLRRNRDYKGRPEFQRLEQIFVEIEKL